MKSLTSLVLLIMFAIAIISFAQNSSPKKESLALDWPEKENWKLASSHEDEQMGMLELVRNDETLANWTELGTMNAYKDVRGKNVEEMMQMYYTLTKKNCAQAKLSILDKNLKTIYPWIIFSIECGKHADGTKPESQVWYVIQGRDALYTNQRALKLAAIPEKRKQAFVKFFKKAKLVYN